MAIVAVTQKLHLRTFWTIASQTPQLPPTLPAQKRSPETEMHPGTQMHEAYSRGGAMRESLESGMPDTAACKEWLGIVGSIVVAALVCAVLFSGGVLT